MEINLEEKKGGSSLEMGKEKKAGSSFEISLPSASDSSLEIGHEEKPGSSAEIGKQKKSGSSVEISLPEEKPGSSVEINLDKKTGSSVEIDLDQKGEDDSPSSSLLLGGPGSDVGSAEPSSDQMTVTEETEEDDSSAVDLASPPKTGEPSEAMVSDSGVATEPPAAVRERGARPEQKKGSGLGLLIGGGVGVLAASLLWIFGLDGLRSSMRESVGLSAEKKTQAASALKQPGAELPVAAHKEDAPKSEPDVEEKKPVPEPVSPPVEKSTPKEEPATPKPAGTAPAPVAEKVAEKGPDLLAQVAPAIKLAKEQKYQEAAAALQKARGAAAADETFARFCDELQASWQLREKLGTAVNSGRQGDPVSTLDSLLKEKKDALAAVTAAMEKIKSADPKAGSLAQGIDSLVEAAKKADDLVKKAEEQVKTAQAGLKKLEKEKEDAQVALTATANLLKPGNYLDAQNSNLAQGVEKLLADKKSSDAQVREANAKLKEAEDAIQDMTQKLVDAKYLKPGEKPVRPARAPSQDADLTLAEKYYSSGVSQYWAGDYAAAEKELAKAIGYFKDDARFFYYFGLACWQQGKREQASEAFQKGTELESRSRPSSAQINATLERIQGGARAMIDQAREHP
jgi:hypothetical protein